jgi:hypothetical protein
MILDLLQDLGFTRNEANVYIFLIRSKLASPTSIAKDLRLSRSTVYSVLANLRKKNLSYFDSKNQTWSPISFDNYYLDCNQNMLLAKKFLNKYSNPELALSPIMLQGKNKCRLAFNLHLRRFVDSKVYLIGSSDIKFAEFFKGISLSNFVLITDKTNEIHIDLAFNKISTLYNKLYSGIQVVIFPDTVWLIGGEFEYCFSVKDKCLIGFILDYLFKEI